MTDIAELQINAEGVKIYAADGAANDRFGSSIAIDGDTMVVGAEYDDDGGAESGAAYIYEWNGSAWVESVKYAGENAGDYFGASVGVSGDTVIVGAYGLGGTNTGKVYIYRKNPAWALEQAITGNANEYLGRSVAVDGDDAAAGGYGGVVTGTAIGLRRVGTTWTSYALTPVPDNRAASDQYGISVDVSGDTIVVGSSGDDDSGGNAGSVYVFDWGGAAYAMTIRFESSDIAAGDQFGQSVAIDGNTIAVGAVYESAMGSQSGAVYIFELSGTWTESCKCLSPLQNTNDRMSGTSVGVAIDGTTVIAGAYAADPNNISTAGCAFVFQAGDSGWATSYTSRQLFACPPLVNAEFGVSVAYDGAKVAIGERVGTGGVGGVVATAGAAYAFEPIWLSPDTSDPVITIVSPVVGSTIEFGDTLTIDVTDDVGIRLLVIMASYPGAAVERATEVVWDGDEFKFPFDAYSSRAAITDGYRYAITRANGWQASPTIIVKPVDTSGNEP